MPTLNLMYLNISASNVGIMQVQIPLILFMRFYYGSQSIYCDV